MKQWQKRFTPQILLMLILTLTMAFSLLPAGSAAAAGEEVEVHFINVGQADGIYIKLPGNVDVVVDSGHYQSTSTVRNYLVSQGVDDIEYLIATHPDADHIGGMVNIFNQFVVENIIDNGDTNDTATFRNYQTARNNEIASGAHYYRVSNQSELFTIPLGDDAQLRLIGPVTHRGDLNNNSVVALLSVGEIDILLTGDAESAAEYDLINAASSGGFSLSAEVLKVAHHGSNSSSTASFLQAVQPISAVISVGPNSYGHPTQAVLNRLAAAGADIYRTDQHSVNGAIVMETDGSAYKINGVWIIEPEASYTLSYNANGGTGTAPAGGEYDSGETVTVAGQGSLAKANYTFSGWNTAANGSGTAYAPGATFAITADTTLYAQWEPIPSATLTAHVGSVTALPGSGSIAVPIIADDNPGIATAMFDLRYDQAVLTLNSLVSTLDGQVGVMNQGFFIPNPGFQPGVGRLVWFYTENVTGNGPLFWAIFSVSETAAAGNYEIIIELADGGIYPTCLTDATNNPVNLDATSGHITVGSQPSVIYGDVDGDGFIAPMDTLRIMQMLTEQITLTPEQRIKADVDGDGNVGPFDAMLIMQYVVKIIESFPVSQP